jgi:two-component system, NtrC family, response regulator
MSRSSPAYYGAAPAAPAPRQFQPGLPGPSEALSRLVGRAPAIERVREVVRLAAAFPSTVLIRGESGTGKELVGRALHELSPRAKAPFVTVDCTVLTETLFESLMFGHEKGSFSGAIASTTGLVRSAEGGTVMLDEIGELPLPEQAKLLRLLQERTVLPVGGTRPIPVDVRFVAATHRDLHAMVAAGRFRADLLYRLDVVGIQMPSLRERAEDIPLIAQALVHSLSKRFGVARRLSPCAVDALITYHWPGNVRQLAALLERAAVLCGGEVIEAQHLDLPESPSEAPSGASAGARRPAADGRLKDSVLDAVRRALDQEQGNRAAAARRLGISRSQLYRLLTQDQAESHAGR